MVMEKQAAVAHACTGMFAEAVRSQQQFALSLLTGATPSQHAARAKSAASGWRAPDSHRSIARQWQTPSGWRAQSCAEATRRVRGDSRRRVARPRFRLS